MGIHSIKGVLNVRKPYVGINNKPNSFQVYTLIQWECVAVKCPLSFAEASLQSTEKETIWYQYEKHPQSGKKLLQ